MKFLSFLMLLPVFAYASADISQFKGHIYKKAELDQCLKDFDVVTKNVSSVSSYTVLSGSCLEVGKDAVQMQFDYLHPLASPVDTFEAEYADAQTCAATLSQAKTEITASGNTFVSTYCEGKALKLHFIDTTRSVTRTLSRLGKFNTQAECLNFVNELSVKAKSLKMFSLLSTCQNNMPVFNYVSHFDLEMGVINGKTVTSAAACTNNSVAVSENFSAKNVKLVYSFCSNTVSYEPAVQEVVLYLVPKNVGKYITEYNGVSFNNKEMCEAQLGSVIRGIESSGDGVLYGHCQKLGTVSFTYRPQITYIKSIQL